MAQGNSGGAVPGHVDRDGRTPFLRACRSGDKERVQELLDAAGGRVPRDRDRHGFDALRSALFHRQTAIAELLVERGVDINARDQAGNTALHTACRHKRADMVKFLLSMGANLNVQNDQGETPEASSVALRAMTD